MWVKTHQYVRSFELEEWEVLSHRTIHSVLIYPRCTFLGRGLKKTWSSTIEQIKVIRYIPDHNIKICSAKQCKTCIFNSIMWFMLTYLQTKQISCHIFRSFRRKLFTYYLLYHCITDITWCQPWRFSPRIIFRVMFSGIITACHQTTASLQNKILGVSSMKCRLV